MTESEGLYAKVEDLLSREAFDERVLAEIEAWGGLLSKEAAGLLVVDALGRNEVTFGEIGDLYEGGEALLDVHVGGIGPVRQFARRDGGKGNVVQLTVSDASGSGRLMLRDGEVNLVTSGTVREGSRIRIVDGLVRQGREGLEVSTGKWGVVLPEDPANASEHPDSQFRF